MGAIDDLLRPVSYESPGAGLFGDLATLKLQPNTSFQPGLSVAAPALNLTIDSPLNLNINVGGQGPNTCGNVSPAPSCKADKWSNLEILNNLNCATVRIKKITIAAQQAAIPSPDWFRGLDKESQAVVKAKAELIKTEQVKGMSQALDVQILSNCSVHYYKGGSQKNFSSTVEVCSSALGQRDRYSICQGDSTIENAMQDAKEAASQSLLSALNAQRDIDLKEARPGTSAVTASAVKMIVTQ